jgi:hypothetical protein
VAQTRIQFMPNRFARVPVSSIAAILLAAMVVPASVSSGARVLTGSTPFQTERSFQLPGGRATRTFTLRERSGVILLNRLTVPHGVRVLVEARIPGLAGARVTSWPARNDPSLSCHTRGSLDVCTQGEEWCPMPQAIWSFRLVKLAGPPGVVRFDYVVAPPLSWT